MGGSNGPPFLEHTFFPIFIENNTFLATVNLFTNTSLSNGLHLTWPSATVNQHLPYFLIFLDLPIFPCREKPPRRNIRQGKLSILSKSYIKFLVRRFYLEFYIFLFIDKYEKSILSNADHLSERFLLFALIFWCPELLRKPTVFFIFWKNFYFSIIFDKKLYKIWNLTFVAKFIADFYK